MSNLKTVKGIRKLVVFLNWNELDFEFVLKRIWDILTRVWSWLRMNAGGVLNTCKSSEALKFDSSDEDFCDWAADGWVTRG